MGKMIIFWERLSLLGVYYDFRLASAHNIKYSNNSCHGSDSPTLLGNVRILRAYCTGTPPKEVDWTWCGW